MAFIPLPLGVKLEFKYRKNGSVIINVMWGIVTATISVPLLENISAAGMNWWTTSRDDQCATTIALEEVKATDWSTQYGLEGLAIASPPAPGTGVGNDMPSNVAAVVSLYTGYSGRSYRGRQYWAGMPDSVYTGNQINTIPLAAMVSDMGQLILDLAGEGFQVGVASFQTAGAPRTTGVITPVTNWGADNVVDTQRRRIPQTFG